MKRKILFILIVSIIVLITATVVLTMRQNTIDMIRKDYHEKYPTTSFAQDEIIPWGIDREQLRLILSESSKSFISESPDSLLYAYSPHKNLTDEFYFNSSNELYKVIYRETGVYGDRLFFVRGMYELLGKGIALNLGNWGLDGREMELISGDISYAFTWVDDNKINELKYSQPKLIYAFLPVEILDGKHEINNLVSKYQNNRNSIRFLSMTSAMTLNDGLFIELSYTTGETEGEGDILKATIINTLLIDR